MSMYDIDNSKPSSVESISSIFASIGAFILSSIEAIVIALAISVVLYLLFMTPHEVVGLSMFPTFHNGEHLIANKMIYTISKPKRGDVIIFKYSDSEDFIKRIIGMPGDTVQVKDGKYYLNGKEFDESEYLESSVYTNGGQYLHEGETTTVPENMYWVSGDNRPHSSDSRDFGPIKKSAIKGKVWLTYYPFDRMKFVKHATYPNLQ